MPHEPEQPGIPSGPERGASARFRRVEEIFFEVAPLSPRDREEAIVRLSGGDDDLACEVRSLVESASEVGPFLDRPALGRSAEDIAAGDRPRDDMVGRVIGSFTVVERVASGGMGTVYLARRSDGQFEQSVAIKLVKRGLDSDEILARFRAERQTLAALDHPHIARLIDGGVIDDGRPFLVMEYVDGVPIDQYCDERRLKLSERLRLFRDVCHAVHHAHRNLVIHRDIKPANILVTRDGTPKLLDFGIAKLLQGGTAAAATIEADRRLTPEYASPEQVAGESLTTATDVYSLGVVLFELLAGVRPYHFLHRTAEEIRRAVCEVDPPAPSAVIALRGTRMRRTTSAPVETPSRAAPPSGGAASEQGVEAPGDRGEARATGTAHTRGVTSARLRSLLRGDLDTIVLMALRKQPRRRYASAEQLADDLDRYLAGMPVRARRDTLGYRAGKFVRRHAIAVTASVLAFAALAVLSLALFRQARALERERDATLALNERLESSRAFLLDVLSGASASELGPDAALGTLMRDAIASFRAAPPDDAVTRAAAAHALASSALSLGMLAEAGEMLDAADAAAHAMDVGFALDVGLERAELRFFEGDAAGAEVEFRRLLAEERSTAPALPSAREGRLVNDIGACLRAQRRFEDAAAAQREAIAIRSAVDGPEGLSVAESRNNLASALFQLGDLEAARGEFLASLAIRERLLHDAHPLVVRCRANLGLVQLRLGELDAAIDTLTRAAGAWDATFGPAHPGRVPTLLSLSQALRAAGRAEDAVDAARRALDWQTRNRPEEASRIAGIEANLALALLDAGRKPEALDLLRRVTPVLESGGPGVGAIAREARAALDQLGG